MIESLKARIVICAVVFLGAIVYVMPNFVDFSTKNAEGEVIDQGWWPSKEKLIYGLDIQGGLHLVMGVDIEGVLKESTKRLASTLVEDFKENNAEVADVTATKPAIGEIDIKLKAPGDLSKVEQFLEKFYGTSLQILDSNEEKVTVRYFENALRDRKEKVIGQAIETLRNRVDEFGVAEPSITAQGTDRILVQLPGIKDANKAKELINKAARLEFMMVHDDQDPAKLQEWITEAETNGKYSLDKMTYSEYIKQLNKDLEGKLPKDTVVYFEKAATARTIEAGSQPYLLRTDSDLGGDDLKDAYVTNDQFGAWQVAINFSPQGGKKFADLTEANIGKIMAVVLDKVVKSAPSIRSKIPNGRGVIELGTGSGQEIFDEAQLIATSLRAGSLPASLQQLEERTVGPSLGADSIERGKNAGILGAILVVLFMLFYYKSFGLIANFALSFNILIIFAVLTSLGATLTLPGVAGIALTLGMAVDANVIIFERIKEELRKGAGLTMAIKDGFGHAFSAIFDANITTGAVCVVLMYFGTGPVRGFAVTLLIGIAASMFTAIFVSRTIFEYLTTKMNVQKMSC